MIVSPAAYAGTGIRVYMPNIESVTAGPLPYTYNGSFMVENDGYTDGVYIVRVAVDVPDTISWVNLSKSAFVLKPDESTMVEFSIKVTPEKARPGTIDFIFTPALLPSKVEPYMDPFAKYILYFDRYKLSMTIPESNFSTLNETPGKPVIFTDNTSRSDLAQSTFVVGNDTIVTEIDRAIKIDMPGTVTAGQPVPAGISVFENKGAEGIRLMVVSPEGTLYPIENDTFTFDHEGKWGVMALVGEEFILGQPVTVIAPGGLLGSIDLGTGLALLSLLLLLAVIPAWMLLPKKAVVRRPDPYDDLLFKTYVVKKNINRFDTSRLKRVVAILSEEYQDLLKRGVAGKKDEAYTSILELSTLADIEENAASS